MKPQSQTDQKKQKRKKEYKLTIIGDDIIAGFSDIKRIIREYYGQL